MCGILLELGAHVELAVHDHALEEQALQPLGLLPALADFQEDDYAGRAGRDQRNLPEQVRQQPFLAGQAAAALVEARAVRDVAQRAVWARGPLLAHLARTGQGQRPIL